MSFFLLDGISISCCISCCIVAKIIDFTYFSKSFKYSGKPVFMQANGTLGVNTGLVKRGLNQFKSCHSDLRVSVVNKAEGVEIHHYLNPSALFYRGLFLLFFQLY